MAEQAKNKPLPAEITDGSGMDIVIVQARFNQDITDRLTQGALEGLREYGVRERNVSVFYVPGSLEIPLAAQQVARNRKPDAIICIGAVIRGETAHFDIVAHQTARGVAAVSLQESTPIIFGVLTTDTVKQAQDRSGTREQNSGWQAALSAIEMVTTIKQIRDVTPRKSAQ